MERLLGLLGVIAVVGIVLGISVNRPRHSGEHSALGLEVLVRLRPDGADDQIRPDSD